MIEDGDSRLEEGLSRYTVASLKCMADFHGVDRDLKKAQLVEALAAHFARRANPTAALDDLDEAARALFDFLQLAGSWVHRDALLRGLAPVGIVDLTGRPRPMWGETNSERGDPWGSKSKVLRDVLARLEVMGLLLGRMPRYGQGTVIDLGTASYYAIPVEVVESLPAVERGTWSRREAPERMTEASPQAFGRALYSLWSFVWRHEPSLLKRGTIAKRALKALAAEYPQPLDVDSATDESDLVPVFRQRWLLGLLGLTNNNGLQLRGDFAAAEAHWRAPLADRVRAWHDAWLNCHAWNELDDIADLVWSHGSWASDEEIVRHVAGARREVAAFLHKELADGGWHSVDRLSALLELRNRDVLLPAARAQNAYYRTWSTRYEARNNRAGLSFPNVRDEVEGWRQVEARFMEQVMRVLHELGLLDLAEEAGTGLDAVRLSALGRHIFADGPSPPEPSGGRMVLQPNFHVLAFGPVAEGELLRLERFADRAATDRALEFVMDADSVYRAQQSGLDHAQILAELEDLTQAAVPQNVRRSLEAWQEAHEQIVVRRGCTLLHTADSELLAELAAMPEASRALRRLGPTFALARDESAVDALLESAALVPVTRHDPRARGSVRLAEDGRVQLTHKFADIYTTAGLHRLAEFDVEGAGAGAGAGVGEADVEGADAGAGAGAVDVEGAGAGAGGDAGTGAGSGLDWRLTAASARAARQKHGLDAEAQIKAWRSLCVDDGPDWLERRMKSWLGSYGKARLRRAWVLELENAEALPALRESQDRAQRARKAGSGRQSAVPLQAFQPKAIPVLVDPDDLPALRDLLSALGIEFED